MSILLLRWIKFLNSAHVQCAYNIFKKVSKMVHKEVTKRCRLSLLTNSAFVYESQCGGLGGGEVAGSHPVSSSEYSCAHHVTWSPNKLWRSTSKFNLGGPWMYV